MNTKSNAPGKILNPYLVRLAFRALKPFGEFHVIVKLAHPGNKLPSYMIATGQHSPGHIAARIPCDQIERVNRDRSVVSVDLRQHVV